MSQHDGVEQCTNVYMILGGGLSGCVQYTLYPKPKAVPPSFYPYGKSICADRLRLSFRLR